MVRTQSMLKTRMGGSRIDQEAVTDLADVSKALNSGGVEREKRRSVETDIIPERIPDDLGFCGDARPP